MKIGFVHLSDIHFGQESGGRTRIHEDVKECLIEDVKLLMRSTENRRAAGIIVTGDIAARGQRCEYQAAATWLDRVALAAGCRVSDILVVPGNHDIDRNEITEAMRMMLDRISVEGESALDKFLEREGDRTLLFRRFASYRPFADGYRCPLDTGGELVDDQFVELGVNRVIRFIRLNSALVCSDNDEKGKLLLGARQRVLPQRRSGEELVVLSHHPLHWFQDSDDAYRYICSRARVFISGHEHSPSVTIEMTGENSHLMILSSGATVPYKSDDKYTYCYNFLEFEWVKETDELAVHIRPRCWIDEDKSFGADDERLGGRDPKFVLGCPGFRAAEGESDAFPPEDSAARPTAVLVTRSADLGMNFEESVVDDCYSLLLLRFFRDISPTQRMRILVSLDALPPSWSGTLNESFERKAFDRLVKAGRSEEIRIALTRMLEQ